MESYLFAKPRALVKVTEGLNWISYDFSREFGTQWELSQMHIVDTNACIGWVRLQQGFCRQMSKDTVSLCR